MDKSYLCDWAVIIIRIGYFCVVGVFIAETEAHFPLEAATRQVLPLHAQLSNPEVSLSESFESVQASILIVLQVIDHHIVLVGKNLQDFPVVKVLVVG